jgi:hypothetical protein
MPRSVPADRSVPAARSVPADRFAPFGPLRALRTASRPSACLAPPRPAWLPFGRGRWQPDELAKLCDFSYRVARGGANWNYGRALTPVSHGSRHAPSGFGGSRTAANAGRGCSSPTSRSAGGWARGGGLSPGLMWRPAAKSRPATSTFAGMREVELMRRFVARGSGESGEPCRSTDAPSVDGRRSRRGPSLRRPTRRACRAVAGSSSRSRTGGSRATNQSPQPSGATPRGRAEPPPRPAPPSVVLRLPGASGSPVPHELALTQQ